VRRAVPVVSFLEFWAKRLNDELQKQNGGPRLTALQKLQKLGKPDDGSSRQTIELKRSDVTGLVEMMVYHAAELRKFAK
jgi:hypothetical protein